MNPFDDFMEIAIEEAKKARDKDEVPIGAALFTSTGEFIASDHNKTLAAKDPSAHAEMLCIRKAALEMQNYRLLNTILCVTIEPCVMCMGAALHARIAVVVFGAGDPKWGALGSIYDFSCDPRFNHHPEIVRGVREYECKALVQDFFKEKRNKQKNGGLFNESS